MRGSTRLKGSGSSVTLYVDDGRYGAGKGGTGGTGDSRPALSAGEAGVNQYEDLPGMDG